MARSIVVAGGMAQRPGYAGHAWQFLQYLLGLQRLGWEVLFLDRLEDEMRTDHAGNSSSLEDSYNVRYFRGVMQRFGLAADYALICRHGKKFIGASRAEVLERARRSTLLLNVMGFLTDESILAAVPRRVFLDTDPGIGQIWKELKLHDLFEGHDAFVTIGENVGQADCEVPTCGIDWIKIHQPVVLEQWPASAQHNHRITSIVSWRGPFGPLEYQGKTYGLRVHEFRKFFELPSLTSARFELLLDIDPVEAKEVEKLEANGWGIRDPKQVAREPETYREFIQTSAAEFMVAKNIYVETRGGWFSDRSMCYLASGKPVIAQDTGLDRLYPVGEGLLTFRNLPDAVAAVEEVTRNYDRHAVAARDIAQRFFDSDKVLGNLLLTLGVG